MGLFRMAIVGADGFTEIEIANAYTLSDIGHRITGSGFVIGRPREADGAMLPEMLIMAHQIRSVFVAEEIEAPV